MAKELQAQYPTGSNIYAIVLNAGGQIWNGSSFETPLLANWTTYAITLTEQSTTGLYQGTMPVLITTAGWYSYLGYLRAGGSAASTDSVIWSDRIPWAGSALAIPGDVGGALATINGKSFNKVIEYIAGAMVGTLSEPIDRSTTTIKGINSGSTIITAANTNDGTTSTRTVTLH